MRFAAFNAPRLTEPGVRYFLSKSLQGCKNTKKIYYTRLTNAIMFVAFVVIIGGVLMYKYKGKPTPQQQNHREYVKQRYILDKVKKMETLNKQKREGNLTGMPLWENEFDVLYHSKRL
jgi:hypothetical protein